MDGEALGNWMIRRGVLDREGLRRVRQRQSVYGGSLDTVVLELGLSDESAVAACLTEATGLPAPRPEWLDTPGPDLARLMDPAAARHLGAQPVARLEDRLEVVTRYGADLRQIGTWAGGLDLGARCYIVPEVRFEALLARVHGKAVPPRFAALLGRIVGRARARQLAEPHAPAARAVAPPLVETGPLSRRARAGADPDNDLDITEDADGLLPPAANGARDGTTAPAAHAAQAAAPTAATGPGPTLPAAFPATLPRVALTAPSAAVGAASAPASPAAERKNGAPPPPEAARLNSLLTEWTSAGTAADRKKELARTLRLHAAEPTLAQALARWREVAAGGGAEAAGAIETLGELRDRESIPLLIGRLGDSPRLSQPALVALRAITRHDFGSARWRWTRWWREWKDNHRVEWLIDALTEKDAELRLEAAQELEELSGRYVGYHFDLGRREREEARRRWFDWWQSTGKATLG
jgi:hypothetical protein